MTIHTLLDEMWRDYLAFNPEVQRIHQLLADQNNGDIVNDHIALRTFDCHHLGIATLAAPFLVQGYDYAGEYHFTEKKLYAQHLEHSDSRLPKVFISELKVGLLSKSAQQCIEGLVQQVDASQLDRDDFCYSGRPWHVSYADYQQLLAESEYAAWMAAFGYRPNHFTVFVNALSSHDSLESLNAYLAANDVQLNTAGGEIKGSPEQYLEQSSTLANTIDVVFSDQAARIASCYYEFARRYPLPSGDLYQGFVAKSADKIFESTDVAR
ncbi:2-oxoadipate dioxygenase/decarboxylase family protein [Eionea flava]